MLSEPTNAIPCSNTVQASITRALAALDRKQYFKLIAGASLTNARAVAALAQVYGALAPARVACIDVAPDWAVVNAAHQVLQTLESPPLLMVSLDVDGDPHFRKAALDADVCTTCQACIPVCPTGAFQLTDSSAPGEHAQLQYHLPDCYGCGRCIPVCPVEALTLQKTETLPEAMVALLQHPAVGAVELHTEALNATTLAPLLITLGDALAGKLVSICFRPNANATQANAALTKLEQWLPQWAGLMFQVDGQPMSGTPDAEATLPALRHAQQVWAAHQPWLERFGVPLTISGGVNAFTGQYLAQPAYGFIAGAAAGTIARQVVWPYLALDSGGLNPVPPSQALKAAQQLVARVLSTATAV